MQYANIEILPYHPTHQPGVDTMMNRINSEFPIPVFSAANVKISQVFDWANRRYLVALAAQQVVGTVGIVVFPAHCVLKAMFVDSRFRGPAYGVAAQLMQTITAIGSGLGCTTMYLGTMQQFAAAQRFYEKSGFIRIGESELPAGFPGSELDTVFYRKDIC